MAKKATVSGGAGRKSAKPGARKAGGKSAAKATPRKPAKAAKSGAKRALSARSPGRRSSDMSASQALVKLIESPLVADLLAVGATAALAAIAAKSSRSAGTASAVKAAGKAAATAMGRRISTEVEEIRKVSKAKGAAKG